MLLHQFCLERLLDMLCISVFLNLPLCRDLYMILLVAYGFFFSSGWEGGTGREVTR